MQIAKLFAGLGFQVDTSGLVKFKRAVADARSEITNISRGAKRATSQFRNLRRETDKLSSSMNKIKNAGGNRNVGGSYRNLAGDVHKVNNAFNQISANRSRTTNAIGKINAAVVAGTPHWNAYRRSIVQTRQTLQNLNGDLNRLRANSRIDVRIRNTGGNGGGGSGGGSGGLGGAGALGGAFGLRAMMGSFLPALAVSSAGGALGFGAARGVEAARDQTRMESMILMTSKSGEEFARTLNYVKDEAARLGLSSTELGKSFAQINMSAKGLDQGTKEEMFTGFSEFMMSMGTSQDDQKGIFRAFNQMFSNNRILQEEINQLSERGIPATLVYDAAMKAYDTTNIQKIKKLQEDGKLDPKKVLPIMAKMVQDLAHDSGSYAKMMESSIVKQGKMYEQLRQTSKQIMDGGLDEYLGDVFGALTELIKKVEELVNVLREIIKGFQIAKDFLDKFTGGADLLSILLLLLIGRFSKVAKGVAIASRVLRANGGVLKALAAIFRGVFGKALGAMILKWGAWAAAIWAVSEAIGFVDKQLSISKAGRWSFFDEMFAYIEISLAKFDLFVAKVLLAQSYVLAFMSGPVKAFTGEGITDRIKKRWNGVGQTGDEEYQPSFKDRVLSKPNPLNPLSMINPMNLLDNLNLGSSGNNTRTNNAMVTAPINLNFNGETYRFSPTVPATIYGGA